MSNKQNTKRVLSIVHNSPAHLIEVFQISDDESTGSDNSISFEDEQRSHNREIIVPEWLELYPWLEIE
ncbi:14232_t:CDS:2, partial [Entrophospora sp. SA101]